MTTSLSRRARAALVAGATLALTAAAAHAAPTAQVVPGTGRNLVAGPDGAMWGLDTPYPFRDIEQVVRFGPDGLATRSDLPAGVAPATSDERLRPLPDGSMGLVVQDSAQAQSAGPMAFLRFAPGTGTLTSRTPLPRSADAPFGFASAPDGTLWFARSCKDEVDHLGTGGRITRIRLPHLGCDSHAAGRERGAGLAFDADGAVWLVNTCMGRVDRIAPNLHVQEWWTPRAECHAVGSELPQGTPPHIVVQPHGGIAVDVPRATRGNTRGVPRRVPRFRSGPAGQLALDGSRWQQDTRQLTRRDPAGRTATFANPVDVDNVASDLAFMRGGQAVTVRARLWQTIPPDPHDLTPELLYIDPALVTVAADGATSAVPLPDGGADAGKKLNVGRQLALAPDGALWFEELRDAKQGPDPGYDLRTVRIVPDTIPPQQTPATTLRTVRTRVGSHVWLQLSCRADLARFCLATATIGQATTRFVLDGATTRTVALRLEAGTVRALRHHRVVRRTVMLTTQGGSPVRTQITLHGDV
jgi:streptogramin lyase